MSSPVLVNELQDGVRRLTLNRPERRNALNSELVEALTQAFREVRHDPHTRVVVLSGAGEKAFCAGADLDPAAAALGPFGLHQSRAGFIALLTAMRDCGRPIIARLAGPAVAGGLGLVAAADLAIAAEDIELSTPEVKRGLFPMMIMALIARNVGRKHALELVLTGAAISAPRAAEIGLINRAVHRSELDATVDALANDLASLSPIVLQLGRQAFYTMEDLPLDQALQYLCGQLTVNTLTEDASEGLMAFVQKRKPEWSGK